MHQPIESCRLYFALRSMAWCGTEPASDAAAGEMEIDPELPRELGLSEVETRLALEDLLEADLIHRVATPEELRGSLDDEAPPGGRLFVEPLDALTAATIILGS